MDRHGLTNTRVYRCWNAMKNRCMNPSHKYYCYYGRRGITVCNEWMRFVPFYEWAMKNGYSDNLSIDRIDNDKGYSPNNCRWVTAKEQAANRRNPTIKNEDGTIGITIRPHGAYEARIYRNKKEHYIGRFRTFEEARKAREEFIRRNNL